MGDMNKKIEEALQPPNYARLDNLRSDVWRRVRSTHHQSPSGFVVPFGLKASALMLVVVAFVALSQVSFRDSVYQADLFDLRYFSYQNIPSVNLAAFNTYELAP